MKKKQKMEEIWRLISIHCMEEEQCIEKDLPLKNDENQGEMILKISFFHSIVTKKSISMPKGSRKNRKLTS